MAVDAPTVPTPAGLSEAEARRRLAKRGKVRPPATSRSYGSIVRANTFTVFNLILVVFGALTLAYGDWRDALFLGILVANTTIGIAQELRAKRALDRLAALVGPTATVVRDGRPREASVNELVVGDLVRVKAGDQVVADGRLSEADGLALDASVLTGSPSRSPPRPAPRCARAPSRSRAPGHTWSRPWARTAMPSASPARRGRSATRALRSSRP
jgi:magnesium-transporting ATPase (P-type)